jgi:hypothetical protein
MPEGLHRFERARSRVRVPPGPSCGPVAQLVEQDVLPNPRRRTDTLANADGNTSGEGFGPRFESASSHQPSSPAPIKTGECRSDYMVEHLPRQAVGGSIPPLGNQVAQQTRLTTTRRPPFGQGRMPSGLHGLQCRRFESGRTFWSVAQWIEHEAVSQTLVAELTIFTTTY